LRCWTAFSRRYRAFQPGGRDEAAKPTRASVECNSPDIVMRFGQDARYIGRTVHSTSRRSCGKHWHAPCPWLHRNVLIAAVNGCWAQEITIPPRSTPMSVGTILLIILILALVGALPMWPYSSSWGYYPTGGLGLIVIIVIILLLLGRI